MFIGHFAVGFAAKRAAPETSLGWLLTASLLLDLIWPVLVLTRVERVEIAPGNTAFTPLAFVHYPVSHSLLAAAVWSVTAAVVYWEATRRRAGAMIIGAAVASHWVLDAIVHTPDLPLYPGSTTFAGLGLWNSIPGTIIFEGSLFAAGVSVYVVGTGARDRIGTWALWLFVILLALIYVSGVLGPPPPGVRAVVLANLAGVVLLFWAGWFDRHRDLWKATSPTVSRAG